MKRGGPKAPFAIHGPLRPIFYLIGKANITAGCFENQFTERNLCDCDLRKQAEATVQALLATTDEGTPVKFRPCGSSKYNTILQIRRGILTSSKKTVCAFNTYIQSYLQLGHFPAP
jgi:hypothetical protein